MGSGTMADARRSLRSLALIVIISGAMLLLAACASDEPGGPDPNVIGEIAGTVKIGPLCPVEPCPARPNPFNGLQVTVETEDGDTVARMEIDESGVFSGEVPAGSYLLFVRPCIHLGCDWAIPRMVEIMEDSTTTVSIDIDTGIR